MPLRGSLQGSLLLPGNCCCACGNAAARAAQRSVPLSCCREFISADLACFPGSGFTSSVISKRRNSPFQSQAAEEPLDPLAGGGTSHIPSLPCWQAPPGPEGRGCDLQDRGCRPCLWAVGRAVCWEQQCCMFCMGARGQRRRMRQWSRQGHPQPHLCWVFHPKYEEGTGLHQQHRWHQPLLPQAAPSVRTLPFPAAPAGPLQLSPKLKPLAFPVQTFPINKWRHHATSPQVTQRRVRGRDGHDHPAPDPLAGRQRCLCLNSRVSKRLADASQNAIRKLFFYIK